ncbi:endonuclease, partial [Lutibacter sp.]|uniref:endonuclease n=1 Tax=Lutibacter sp. TaxID=1925666 RepID=UPI003563CA8D
MKNFYFKKQLFFLAVSIFFTSFGYSQVQSYYNDVNLTLTGTALKDELATKIISTHTKFLSYDGAREALKIVDLEPGSSTHVLLLYGFSNNTCPSSTGDDNDHRLRDKNSFGGGSSCEWNREHTYAKSLGSPNLGTSGPGSDAHHLRASDVQRNSNRGSLKFVNGSGNSGSTGSGWYPGDEWKGDVARMMMYMYLRYGNQCYPSGVAIGNTNSIDSNMIDLLLDWNAQDPVSTYEDVRNTYLSNTSNTYGQGNRNPFIDNPNLATQIWGGTVAEDRWNTTPDTEDPTAPTFLVASNVTNTTVELNWVASTDNTAVVSYAIYVNGLAYSTSTTNSVTLSGLALNTLYNITVYALDAVGNTSVVSNTETITTTNIIDAEIPSTPTNLVSSETTQTETLLTWTPSTDNMGVSEYQIFSGVTQIGTTTSIPYTVTGLIANTTYTFTVKAVDAAGNISLESNSETLTTLEDIIITPSTGDSIVFQGYEGALNDTWTYTQSLALCNNNGDVWDIVSSLGSISAPKTGASFFGVQDLEGNCGTSAGGTISFDTVDISVYTDVNLSFAMNVDGFDVSNGDIITYEIFHDNVSQGVVTVT